MDNGLESLQQNKKEITDLMKDRVRELIREAENICAQKKQCTGCVGLSDGCECVDRLITEHLIANGVIAPSVFVGQTVYHYCVDFGCVLPYFVENMNVGYLDKERNYWTYEANCHDSETDELLDEIDFDYDDIGKTIFLSFEDCATAYRGGGQRKEDENGR